MENQQAGSPLYLSAVKAEIKKQTGRGRILKIESITKNNAIVAYEALIRSQRKLKEIKIDPDGKLMPEDDH